MVIPFKVTFFYILGLWVMCPFIIYGLSLETNFTTCITTYRFNNTMLYDCVLTEQHRKTWPEILAYMSYLFNLIMISSIFCVANAYRCKRDTRTHPTPQTNEHQLLNDI